MRTIGALPQVMAFSEAYQALQTGVVDGTENPHSNMYTQKMHEVQKHMAVTDHGYLGYAVIVNKKFWEGLPDDIRQGMEKAMDEATVYANDIAEQENNDSMKAMEESGKTQFYQLSDAEREEWVKQLRPVHKEMASRIGQDAAVRLGTEPRSGPRDGSGRPVRSSHLHGKRGQPRSPVRHGRYRRLRAQSPTA